MRVDLLIKLLALTQSPVDGEALAAIRKANKLMADAGISWNDLLQPLIEPAHEPRERRTSRLRRHAFKQAKQPQKVRHRDAAAINALFEFMSERPAFAVPIDRLRRYWFSHAFLTAAQFGFLQEAAESCGYEAA